MSLLDIYLQKNGKKRYDVYKVSGLSQQMLASINKKKVESYSVKTIQAIAKTLGKSEGEVLEELIKLQKENPYFEVYSSEDLLIALENKESYILIKGEYQKELKKLLQATLTETETMGMELGSAGLVNILGEVFYKLFNLFDKTEETQKKIESQLRKYKYKKMNENEILLYLRQMDY